MNIKKTVTGLLAAVALGSAIAVPAMAQNFASYQATAGDNYQFTNAGASSSFATLSNQQVLFEYLIPNGTGVVAPTTISATLSLSSTVDGLATTSGSSMQQNLKDVLVTVTANTPIDGMTNLLTATGTGQITGILNTHTGLYSSDAAINLVTYSSDFLVFPVPQVGDNYTINLNSTTPALSIATNGYLTGFTAGGNGTFSGAAASTVPEPTSIAAFAFTGMGLLGLMLFARKRRGSMTA